MQFSIEMSHVLSLFLLLLLLISNFNNGYGLQSLVKSFHHVNLNTTVLNKYVGKFIDNSGLTQVLNFTLYHADDCRLNCHLPFVKSDVHFYLFSGEYIRKLKERSIFLKPKPEQLFINKSKSIDSSLFDKELPLKIIIHGFTSSYKSHFEHDLAQAYVNVGNYNVVGVDWSKLCQAPNYGLAVSNTRPVGVRVAEFIDYLIYNYNLKLNDIHIIGHSLGAHVSGIVGKNVKSGKIWRITGLDPALPLYDILPDDFKLSKSDADFVDVIHTTGGNVGYMEPLGHMDFYPNGGMSPQPGCNDKYKGVLAGCSHSRAYKIFIESVENKNAFPSTKCNDLDSVISRTCDTRLPSNLTVFMGEYVHLNLKPSETGLFYTTTNDAKPYGKRAE